MGGESGEYDKDDEVNGPVKDNEVDGPVPQEVSLVIAGHVWSRPTVV